MTTNLSIRSRRINVALYNIQYPVGKCQNTAPPFIVFITFLLSPFSPNRNTSSNPSDGKGSRLVWSTNWNSRSEGIDAEQSAHLSGHIIVCSDWMIHLLSSMEPSLNSCLQMLVGPLSMLLCIYNDLTWVCISAVIAVAPITSKFLFQRIPHL